MKEISSAVHLNFTYSVYNHDTWAAGGDPSPEHSVTVAGGLTPYGPGEGVSSFPYFSHRIFAPPDSSSKGLLIFYSHSPSCTYTPVYEAHRRRETVRRP